MRHLITFRHLTIANDLLPAIVNDDPTGLDDGDHKQLNRFLADLETEITGLFDPLLPYWPFHDLIVNELREDDFRRCDVTGLQALCSPITVMVTTYGGASPDARLYEYPSFAS